MSRLTNTLRAVMEVNERCWRGDECELSNGVRLGLEQLAEHSQQHSEISEVRVCSIHVFWSWQVDRISQTRALYDTTLEAIKVRHILRSQSGAALESFTTGTTRSIHCDA